MATDVTFRLRAPGSSISLDRLHRHCFGFFRIATTTMAGTRLFIQATVLVQFLILVAVAIYFGLCQQGDDICSLLFHSKDRRLDDFAKKASPALQVPVVSIVVPGGIVKWRTLLEQQSPHVSFRVVTSPSHSAVCSSDDTEKAQQHDVWICRKARGTDDEAKNEANIKILSRGESSLVYLYTDNINEVVENLFSSSLKQLVRRSLRFTLVTQDREWMSWSTALTQLLESVSFSTLPCLKGGSSSMTSVVVDGSLSDLARLVTQNNETVYQVSTRHVQDFVSSVPPLSSDNDPALTALLYVPGRDKTPMIISEQRGASSSTSGIVDLDSAHTLLSIVNRTSFEDEELHYSDAIREALAHVVPFLQSRCLGFDPIPMVESGSSIPTWQIKMALQRLLRDTHQQAQDETIRLHRFLMESSTSVDPKGEATKGLLEASDMIGKAIQHSRQGQYDLAIDYLEASLQRSRSVLADANVMEPVDFPLEHAFAIFSPLLFPLLVPLVVGLIRELKRYKKLKKAKVS